MQSSSSLATTLITYRKRRGISQEELADLARLSLRTVQRLEKGETLPRGFTLQALAKALDLPVDALTTAEDESLIDQLESAASDSKPDEAPAYVALMYLSAFTYLILPGVNILLPLFMRYRKRHNPQIQEAGSRLLNFELVWTLVTYGGYLLLLAVQIGLILNFQIVIVWTPLVFLFLLNAIHAPLLLIGAWRARKGRYAGYPVGLRLF
jgi:transcriptional regulator with XRE-family HTH domain